MITIRKKSDVTLQRLINRHEGIPAGWLIPTDAESAKISKYLAPKYINGQIVESATPEEIIKNQQDLAINSARNFNQMKRQKGEEFFNEVDARLTGIMFNKTPIQINYLDKEYRGKLLKYVTMCRDGQWFTARQLLDGKTLPTNSEIRQLFLFVRQSVRDFVSQYYPINLE